MLRERKPLAARQILCIPEERFLETHANFNNTICTPAIGAGDSSMYSQTCIASEPDSY